MWDLSFGEDAREKSRVSEGYELPRGVRGHAPPPPLNVSNENVLRCNLVHFETQFWEMLQWYFVWFFWSWSRSDNVTILHVPCHIVSLDREYFTCTDLVASGWFFRYTLILIYCNDNNIFGEEAGHFGGWGGSFYFSKTLHKILMHSAISQWCINCRQGHRFRHASSRNFLGKRRRKSGLSSF